MNDAGGPIWEIWNWTSDDRLLFGGALVLFAVFVAGMFTGRDRPKVSENWAIAGIVAGIVGFGILIWRPR